MAKIGQRKNHNWEASSRTRPINSIRNEFSQPWALNTGRYSIRWLLLNNNNQNHTTQLLLLGHRCRRNVVVCCRFLGLERGYFVWLSVSATNTARTWYLRRMERRLAGKHKFTSRLSIEFWIGLANIQTGKEFGGKSRWELFVFVNYWAL